MHGSYREKFKAYFLHGTGEAMNYYNRKICVDVHDVDFNGIARTSALMRYIQSAAQWQLTDNGHSYDNLKSLNKAFILSRIKLEFTESVYAYDSLEAETFPCDSHGFTFLRCYLLKKADRVIGRAVSAWALVDTEKHSLVKVNDFDLGLETYKALDFPLGRIVMPRELDTVGTYTVNYADLDQNNHMNNTRYPDMYSNFLPLDKKRIRSITVSYMNEAASGERLTVQRAYSDGSFYFRTLRQDGKINTEAEIQLADI